MVRTSCRLAALVALVLAPTLAAAGPIRITAGSLDIVGLDPVYFRPAEVHLVGERGFTLDAVTGSGSFGAGNTCLYGCDPGTFVSLAATWGGIDLIGSATLDGERWAHVGGMDDDASAVVTFDASVRVPSSTAPVVSATVPFEFHGLFGHLSSERAGMETLVGRGTAEVTFEHPLQPDLGFYELRRTVFTFSPIPEPGTLALVGTGLAAGARGWFVRARNRRRTR